MGDFSGKTIWITGASSGIGKACAAAFAEAGATTILSGRRVEALQALADELPTEAHILPFEVTDYPVLKDKVEAAWAFTGRVDVFINNAGVSQRSLAIHTEPQVYTDLINIDLIAPIWLTSFSCRKWSRPAALTLSGLVLWPDASGRPCAPPTRPRNMD